MESKKKLIAPSILTADFSKLGVELKKIEKAGADLIHVDVMDGHFVPNITIGPLVVRAIRKSTNLPLDCHLMISNPDKYIEAFADAGADMISVHVEACDLSVTLSRIKKLHCKAGAVINPPTNIEKLLPYVDIADFILVMTVNPGFGGQQLIDDCVKKISVLDKYRQEKKLKYLIEVDGGIKLDNIKRVADSGCDIFVAGSAIFDEPNYSKIIGNMKEFVAKT